MSGSGPRRATPCLPDIPDHGYDTSAEALVLRRALATLQADYRDPLLLQVIGGFSCREIGDILEAQYEHRFTCLFRARKTLRDLLTG